MNELSKTYTLTHSGDGWRVNFSTGMAPGFELEPHHTLFEVIDRVEMLYPEYQPRLTVKQLADYQLQMARRGYAQELQKIISQTGELKVRLIDLSKKLLKIGAGQDRAIAEDLAVLHHQLSDLRAHVDIARREVALAKRTVHVKAKRISQPIELVNVCDVPQREPPRDKGYAAQDPMTSN